MTSPGSGRLDVKDSEGHSLCPEAQRLLEHLRKRSRELDVPAIRERLRSAILELDKIVEAVPEAEIRRRPAPDKWNIAEVVDHIAQTQIRCAEELRHLFASRRPPGPPVYEALRSGGAGWAAWPELLEGLRSANREVLDVMERAPGEAEVSQATAKTILVVPRALADGGTAPQIFAADLDWREYALVVRLHVLDHRTQIKNVWQAFSA